VHVLDAFPKKLAFNTCNVQQLVILSLQHR
jgi:hypothetical protein